MVSDRMCEDRLIWNLREERVSEGGREGGERMLYTHLLVRQPHMMRGCVPGAAVTPLTDGGMKKGQDVGL